MTNPSYSSYSLAHAIRFKINLFPLSKNKNFPYSSSFATFLHGITKLMNSNNYFITISSISNNKDYY